MKKVLVFELNNYHTETFPIYEELLPSLLGDRVDVEYCVMPGRYADTAKIYTNVHRLCSEWIFFFVRHFQLRVPFFTRIIKRIVRDKKPDMVVFNSVEPDRHYRIFKKIAAPKKLGLIHNPKKSRAVKTPNEFYFVLGKSLYETFKADVPLDGYLLPFFRQFDFPARKAGGKRLIAVQGLVSFKRRDYPFLIEAAKELQQRGIDDIVFNIIGSRRIQNGEEFFKMVRENGVEDYFLFYDELDDREFFEQIHLSDCIMTLLHEKQSHYYREKTTASFSHAAAYHKPLILARENAEAWGVGEDMAVIYDNLESFVETIIAVRPKLERVSAAFGTFIDASIEENRKQLAQAGAMHA